MKIVFFGDSLTQGTFGASYVDRLAKLLPGHHFYNEGVNGDTSLNLLRRSQSDVIARRADGVFVMIGVNDAISFVEPGSSAYYRLIKRVPGGKISPIAFRENMRALLTRLLSADLRVWAALPPIESRPAAVKTLREMNRYNADVCAEINIPTLDLMARFTPNAVPERRPVGLWTYQQNLSVALGWRKPDQARNVEGYSYSFDGVHLTENGAQRFAEEIAHFLRQHGVA